MKNVKVRNVIGEALQKMLLEVEVILYEDEVKERACSNSNINLLILLNKETILMEDEIKIFNAINEAEQETGILIDYTILTKDLLVGVLPPFYEKVMKEGIVLL